MPRYEFRSVVHVRCLMDFILFEPPGYAARYGVASIAGKKAPVQFEQRVAKHCTLHRIDRSNVTPDAVSKCHVLSPVAVDASVVTSEVDTKVIRVSHGAALPCRVSTASSPAWCRLTTHLGFSLS